MGVRGLTTFINSNSNTFFINFKLHDCTLIIDGNSLAAVLYCDALGPHSAFGGDYDVYAQHAENFVNNLRKCNVEPIFIFDGGYEGRKAFTVKKRNEKKVFAIDKVIPSRPARDFFPFIMRPVLQERLLDLGVTCLQSDHEADREIAAIAKRLNAPVLSNDSDFFIFDIQFIPLSRFSFDLCQSSSKLKTPYNYMSCQVFAVDNFLQTFGGLEKKMLPLLATILGNDYLNRSTFKNFYRLIKLDKSKKITLGQRRIGGLVKWLNKENFESALKKILVSLPRKRRSLIRRSIYSIVNCYSNLSSCLETSLPELVGENKPHVNYDQICAGFDNIDITSDSDTSYATCIDDDDYLVENISENSTEDEVDVLEDEDVAVHEDSEAEVLTESEADVLENEEADIVENASEEAKAEWEEIIVNAEDSGNPTNSAMMSWFFERSRRCQIAPQVITLLTLRTFFCIPQMEDCSLPHAGKIGIPILRIIAGLSLGSGYITYWHRQSSNSYRPRKLTIINSYSSGKLPQLYLLHQCSLEVRKNILLDTLKIEKEFLLDSFPEDWHLLILCLIYWMKNVESIKPYHIHAVILMVIVINVYTKKIGYFRKSRSFLRIWGAKVKGLEKIREKTIAKVIGSDRTIIQELAEVTPDDCLITFENILPNFNVDFSLKDRPRLFQRSIIHCYAELQTVLDLAQTLNSLLLQPYLPMKISRLYNGTFLYNIAANFKRQPDIIKYLEKLFKKSPSLLSLHMSFFKYLYKFVGITDIIITLVSNNRRKKRKKKTIMDKFDEAEKEEISEDLELFHDENNKFSLLPEIDKL